MSVFTPCTRLFVVVVDPIRTNDTVPHFLPSTPGCVSVPSLLCPPPRAPCGGARCRRLRWLLRCRLHSCGDVLERRREGLLDSAGHGWGEKAEERRRVFAAADRYPSSMTPGF